MEKLVHKKKTGGLLDTLKTVFWAIVIALMVRTFAFEPFNIPSGSMIPTLLVGDYLFVSKFSYGYSKHSMPFSLPIIPGRVFESEPERGDVVVFKLPSDTSQDYIKRVIGLPGDTVQVKEGRLYINNKMIERERIEDYILTDGGGRSAAVPQYIETLPNGRVHRVNVRPRTHGNEKVVADGGVVDLVVRPRGIAPFQPFVVVEVVGRRMSGTGPHDPRVSEPFHVACRSESALDQGFHAAEPKA